MNTPTRSPMPARQRGAASLAVALLLLLGMTLIAFYAHRGLLFEQRGSANHYRATRAFELAEAGIEWATARLNDTQRIDAACAASSDATASTFRDLYLRHTLASVGFDPLSEARPGCRLPADGAPAVCSCPALPLAAIASDAPTFSVRFAAVPGDPESVEIRSLGCLGALSPCSPNLPIGPSADATAQVRVVVKLLPALRTPPQAALTAGGSVALGGAAAELVNTDTSTHGITIDAGGAVAGAAGHAVTLPGVPPEASVLGNDAALRTLAVADPAGEALFRAHFGQTMADYKAAHATTVVCDAAFVAGRGRACTSDALPCVGAAGCGAVVVAAVASGRNQFWLDAELRLDAGTLATSLGTPIRPVLLVTPWALALDSGAPVYGLLYGAAATTTPQGSGTLDVRGAVMARGDFSNAVPLALRYDAGVLRRLRTATGTLVRVPGSWRDF